MKAYKKFFESLATFQFSIQMSISLEIRMVLHIFQLSMIGCYAKSFYGYAAEGGKASFIVVNINFHIEIIK